MAVLKIKEYKRVRLQLKPYRREETTLDQCNIFFKTNFIKVSIT